jgi:hypothetical protein
MRANKDLSVSYEPFDRFSLNTAFKAQKSTDEG